MPSNKILIGGIVGICIILGVGFYIHQNKNTLVVPETSSLMEGMNHTGMNHTGMNDTETTRSISQDILQYGKNQIASGESKQEEVFLQSGDTYTLEITKVLKNIGGKQIEMLAYNGSIPGPLIKTTQGAKVYLKLVNKVQDLETTLHSHGLRLEDIFDGVPKKMMGSQDEIKYGDTFTYELSFPDVGIFWYHPHVREDIQQELGLYGNYLVQSNTQSQIESSIDEQTLILDDIALNGNEVKPFYKDFVNYVLMGRYGNTFLLNGTSDYTLHLNQGKITRLYLTNVANTRVFNLKIPGVKMKRVGSDIGYYQKEEFIDSLIIAPAERYIIDIYPEKSGEFQLQNDTGYETYTIGKVVVNLGTFIDEKQFNTLMMYSSGQLDIEKFIPYLNKPVEKTLELALGKVGQSGSISPEDMGMGGHNMGGMNMEHGQVIPDIEYEDTMPMMNKNSTSLEYEWKIIETDTGKENMDIHWEFNKGDMVKVQINNPDNNAHPMQHPFHIHGQRFLIVSRNGVPETNLVWKDTVLVKTGEKLEILVDMSNPGNWMSHCHISEHLSSGMMMHFSVKE